MSAVTASLCSTLMFVAFVSADLKVITTVPGRTITLTCRAPNNNITVVKWSRPDLRDKYMLLYHDGQFDPHNQHPSFSNRVDLQDRQMKDGDVSLILKNVTINDDGTYECGVFMEKTHSWKLSNIHLSVLPEPKILKAESGHDVTLPCRAPNNNITVVKWSRADLGDTIILFYDKHDLVQDNQHPSFKNQVDLQDRQIKNGDLSLILKDVTTNDTGIYGCRVYMEETESWNLISIIYLHVADPPDPKIITAKSGQDVTLTCRAPTNNIPAVKWSRGELGDEYVLLHRDDELLDPEKQHPSFKNRLDLQDRQMNDGDASLILKDVTIYDAGIYECGVFVKEARTWKLISIIDLHVDPPGKLGGYEASMIALIVFQVTVLLIIIFWIYKNSQKQRINLCKKFRRSARYSLLPPAAVPNSHSYTTQRKNDDQGQKETDNADLHLQSPGGDRDELRIRLSEDRLK